jgi:hypothetical protein
MARDAGYRDHADACATTGEDGSDLRVTLVADGRTAREVQAFRDGYAEGFRCAASELDDGDACTVDECNPGIGPVHTNTCT